MTDKIEVKVLQHNIDGTPLFLAKLTQRGHEINDMADLVKLYDKTKSAKCGSRLLALPHSTIKRMNYITIAIVGLSTKAVSQLRTHATRMSFVSTSTQYSSFEEVKDAYVIPPNLTVDEQQSFNKAYAAIHGHYADLITKGVDKDAAGYLLPQSLKKVLIISGHLDAWEYLLRTRLCRRNTEEVQNICKLIMQELNTTSEIPKSIIESMLPQCVKGKCPEGKFCCGNKLTYEEITNT